MFALLFANFVRLQPYKKIVQPQNWRGNQGWKHDVGFYKIELNRFSLPTPLVSIEQVGRK